MKNGNASQNKAKTKKRSEASKARRAARWATQKAQKKAESIARQKEKQEAKKDPKKIQTVLNLFPNVMGVVGAQGFMPNIKRSVLLSKNVTKKLQNTPLFQNADRSTIYPNGQTLLNKYLEERKWDEAMKVLNLGVSKKILEQPLRFLGEQPLVYCYHHRKIDLFKKLLEKGANPNVLVGSMEFAPPLLHLICGEIHPSEEKLEFIKALIAHKADYLTPDKAGFTPLEICIVMDNILYMEFFVNLGVDIEKPNKKGFTPLLTAISHNHLHSLRYMIEKRNPDLNKQTGPNKLSPLKVATLNGKGYIFDEILKHDIDVNQKDNLGNTALHYAIMARNYDKILLLKRKGADPSIKNNKGVSALELAQKIFPPHNPKTLPTLQLLEE